jgi:hypothetical protein
MRRCDMLLQTCFLPLYGLITVICVGTEKKTVSSAVSLFSERRKRWDKSWTMPSLVIVLPLVLKYYHNHQARNSGFLCLKISHGLIFCHCHGFPANCEPRSICMKLLILGVSQNFTLCWNILLLSYLLKFFSGSHAYSVTVMLPRTHGSKSAYITVNFPFLRSVGNTSWERLISACVAFVLFYARDLFY